MGGWEGGGKPKAGNTIHKETNSSVVCSVLHRQTAVLCVQSQEKYYKSSDLSPRCISTVYFAITGKYRFRVTHKFRVP